MANDWAEKQAENILDAFIEDDGADDLLHLQQAIASALRSAYQRGKTEQLAKQPGSSPAQGRESRGKPK